MENPVVHEPIVLMEEEHTHRKLAIVDIDQVGNDPDLMEDLIDIIIAEARKGEEKISWRQVKEELELN
ncbi:MAG: hypothetical protein MUF24_09975 [Chitinophagaceae bacterium]|jgi:hypothetical protein|nr:hypothetical protein [Chitinophagaceae bacterium]